MDKELVISSNAFSDLSNWQQALTLVQQFGDSGMCYLHLRPDKSLFLSSDGAASLGFGRSAGCAVVLGQPVGPAYAWDHLIDEFEAFCTGRGMVVAFCGIGDSALRFFHQRGYRSLKVGDEAIIDLPTLELCGKSWRECRIALNRARKQGFSFELVPSEERNAVLLADIEGVSREWLTRRPLPELTFAMSTSSSIRDPRTLLAVARGTDGQVQGFATWVPIFASNGWMLDLMRRRTSTMAGLMDFLITRSLLWMKDAGNQMASLGGTPLSNIGCEDGGLMRHGLDLVFRHVRAGYRFQSLLGYKQKFNPRWEPLYLVYQSGASSLRICYAIARACAPNLGLRHLIKCLAMANYNGHSSTSF